MFCFGILLTFYYSRTYIAHIEALFRRAGVHKLAFIALSESMPLENVFLQYQYECVRAVVILERGYEVLGLVSMLVFDGHIGGCMPFGCIVDT